MLSPSLVCGGIMIADKHPLSLRLILCLVCRDARSLGCSGSIRPVAAPTAQSRVKSSIEVVQAVQDLKTSIASLDQAMQKQDWESATRFTQRAAAIEPSIVASSFAEAVVVSPRPHPPRAKPGLARCHPEHQAKETDMVTLCYCSPPPSCH